jgi:hypothetical protein
MMRCANTKRPRRAKVQTGRGRAPTQGRMMGTVSPGARCLRRKRHAYASTSLFSSMIRKNTSVGGRLFPASQRWRSSVVRLRISATCLSP